MSSRVTRSRSRRSRGGSKTRARRRLRRCHYYYKTEFLTKFVGREKKREKKLPIIIGVVAKAASEKN